MIARIEISSIEGRLAVFVAMSNAVQVWNPDDWELFAFSLLQGHHGSLSVQTIPESTIAARRTQSPTNATPSRSQLISPHVRTGKKKITTDLGKLIANHIEVGKLFHGTLIKHWVLMSPLHDSKDVNLHCAKKTKDLRESGCVAFDPAFEVTIQELDAFPAKAVASGIASLSMVTLSIPSPTQSEVDNWSVRSTDLLANATAKLKKRALPDQLDEFVAEAVQSFLQGNALLDALRSSSPDLHDKVMAAVKSRSRRLEFAGQISRLRTY